MPKTALTTHPSRSTLLSGGAGVRCFATVAEARAAGWDDLPTGAPFSSCEWLQAFTPTALGGAGGPAATLLTLRSAGDERVRAVLQRLPVARMRLGDAVDPAWVACGLGSTAYQFGQALFSGPAHASTAPPTVTAALLAEAASRLGHEGAWLLKDLPVGTPAPAGWVEVPALPEMAMAIPERWRSFDDYLADLPSKYRRRARRARAKLAGLERRPLSATEAERFGDSLTARYADLMARTPYAPFVVEDGYVARLKALRPDEVALTGYFDGGRLVGFSTLLCDGGEGLAHLAAVDPAYNPTHQLYLNLLLDLLDAAIGRRCRRLNYGRTATTIKSSIGAQPVQYVSFVRHTGRFRHQLLRPLVSRVLSPTDRDAQIQRPLG